MPYLNEASDDNAPLRLPQFGVLLASLITVAIALLVAQTALEPPHVWYRVCNGTKTNLEQVSVLGFRNIPMKPGEFSEYREGSGLVSEVGISVFSNGTWLQSNFDDYMRQVLPKGEYTYVIEFAGETGVRAVLSDGSQCK